MPNSESLLGDGGAGGVMHANLGDFGPWGFAPRLSVVILCDGENEELAVATVTDILGSTFQDFEVCISSGGLTSMHNLQQWVLNDRRFSFSTGIDRDDLNGRFVLTIPAGWRLTRYSLEALLAAVQAPGVMVVRALIAGQRNSLEIFDSRLLAIGNIDVGGRAARKTGAERWIDGSEVGMHAFASSAPKVFFRKGKADRHILEFHLLDTKSAAVRKSQLAKTRALESEIRRLHARLDGMSMTVDRRRPVFPRTLKYFSSRASRHIRRLLKSGV